MSLIRDQSTTETTNGVKRHHAKMVLEAEPFADVLKSKRRRLDVTSLSGMVEKAQENLETYKDRRAQARLLSGAGDLERDDDAEDESGPAVPLEAVFAKGQSKRIWNELYRYAGLPCLLRRNEGS